MGTLYTVLVDQQRVSENRMSTSVESDNLVREQLTLLESESATASPRGDDKASFNDPAFGTNKSLPVHRWVPWIAGFSSDFVHDAISRHLSGNGTVLDPFAGVGTTLVEAMRLGHDSIGFEINPYAVLACRVKLKASRLDAFSLRTEIDRLTAFYLQRRESGYQPFSQAPEGFRTKVAFYSPPVLRKVLIIHDYVESLEDESLKEVFQLAFASTMIQYSNYSYEPSLGTRAGAGKKNIEDFSVLETVVGKLSAIAEDVLIVQRLGAGRSEAWEVINDSFFNYQEHLRGASVDLLITSPPYLNNYHYIRNTRPHLYWLGFVEKPQDTKHLEHTNFGKFWQTVRDQERLGLNFSLPDSDLAEKVEHIRTLNPEKGVYGGNGWANYAAAYFNDCYRFAQAMQYVLKPGSKALVVIGNSILQGVNIPTDLYLGQIAEAAGLELLDIHTPRATRVGNSIIESDVRVAKAQKGRKLYEAVVELRKR